jgi:hypothetical protein
MTFSVWTGGPSTRPQRSSPTGPSVGTGPLPSSLSPAVNPQGRVRMSAPSCEPRSRPVIHVATTVFKERSRAAPKSRPIPRTAAAARTQNRIARHETIGNICGAANKKPRPELRNGVLRRGGDSNPRCRFTPHDGLANRYLKPLGHLSICTRPPDVPAGQATLSYPARSHAATAGSRRRASLPTEPPHPAHLFSSSPRQAVRRSGSCGASGSHI